MNDKKAFWRRNICQAEFIKDYSKGSKEFFKEAERIRYKYYYYLPELFNHMARCKPKGQLLEIGCGMGTDLIQLARNFQVTGIDITPEAIELAEKRFKMFNQKGNFYIGDAEDLKFESNSFDVVYSFGVLHHLENTQQAINEIYRVLKPNGIAIVMLYHRRSFNYWVHRLLNQPFDGNRKDRCPIEKTYTKREASMLFQDFSYHYINTWYFIGTGYGKIWDIVPMFVHKLLGPIIGWHIIITAVKMWFHRRKYKN